MSKELEAFRDILGILSAVSGCEVDMNSERIITVKQALIKAEKVHKALEIIKKKTVDIWLIQNKKTLKQYNSMVDESRQLTEEEFNLLKEVLK